MQVINQAFESLSPIAAAECSGEFIFIKIIIEQN